MPERAQRAQRVAAYAVIVRDDLILLSRLSRRVTRTELWTLPGGGLDHGEDPRDAVVREVYEETGLMAAVGPTAHTYSLHLPGTWRKGRRVDAHSLRIVYEGWVPRDAPEPHVVEVDGSTAEAAWLPLADVLDGTVPTVALVLEALEAHRPHRHQRVAAYAYAERDDALLLTRISSRGYGAGAWTLPGGGVDHAEHPTDAVRRELAEECGLSGPDVVVGDVLTVHDLHVEGTAPSGRREDFHGIHLVYRTEVPAEVEPHVVETGGTTDAVAWVPLAELTGHDDGERTRPVLDVVRAAIAAAHR